MGYSDINCVHFPSVLIPFKSEDLKKKIIIEKCDIYNTGLLKYWIILHCFVNVIQC